MEMVQFECLPLINENNIMLQQSSTDSKPEWSSDFELPWTWEEQKSSIIVKATD